MENEDLWEGWETEESVKEVDSEPNSNIDWSGWETEDETIVEEEVVLEGEVVPEEETSESEKLTSTSTDDFS